MLSRFVLACVILSAPGLTIAQPKTEAAEKAAALALLKKHSETVACYTNFEGEEMPRPTVRDVYTVERNAESGSATYFVKWFGDVGCWGGSGTTSFVISEVSRDSESRPFRVRTNNAFGDGVSEALNLRFIESMQRTSGQRFVVTSSEHAKGDGNNFPTEKFQYTLEQVDHKWKVVNKKFVGKTKF